MSGRSPVYCVDTSALIAAWDERYPIDTFPALWDALAELIQAGRLIAPDEVEEELKRKSQDLLDWIAEVGSPFVPSDQATLAGVTDILDRHERLVAAGKRASAADPFVITLARLRRATVVTEEYGGTATKPKIPFVCSDYGVTCISLLDMLRAERLVIGRSR